MIEAEGLTRKFGDRTAVEDLTFRVSEGEIFGLLGPNGAGKTTVVRMLACLLAPTRGTAKVGGFDIGNPSDSLKVRNLLGLVPDNPGLYEALTAYQNLDFYGKLFGVPAAPRAASIERFLRMLGLWNERDLVVGTFSKGMKQKVAVARALIHDPQVLFLDEPTANLDPESARTVRDFILGLKQEKKTIFLNTHNLDEAQRICDRIAILNTRLVRVGTPRELEESVSGRKVVFQLASVTDALVAAVERLAPGRVAREGNRLTVDVQDAESESPALVEALVRAGGQLQSVSRLNATLEDTYLTIVRSER
ncbi:MAG: ABC transporter ATP-binding protein [Thermoplasmata archaeon]|nr:ABC transporter ATP-binding protein [Thermoplasmata archaeon]MCI4362006.1 ABC transporter ATP-binding protein [Thermoplasmata archaeon]